MAALVQHASLLVGPRVTSIVGQFAFAARQCSFAFPRLVKCRFKITQIAAFAKHTGLLARQCVGMLGC